MSGIGTALDAAIGIHSVEVGPVAGAWNFARPSSNINGSICSKRGRTKHRSAHRHFPNSTSVLCFQRVQILVVTTDVNLAMTLFK
jgi:hypothetical protein